MAQAITLPKLQSSDTSSKPQIKKTPQSLFQGKGLKIQRRFTQKGLGAEAMIDFDKRSSKISEPDGRVVFEMKDIEVPSEWSQLATDILAQKYFRKRGVPGTESETSAKQVIHRIAHTIREFGEAQAYFADENEADSFEEELKFMLFTQRGAFNSPVWFNCGLFHIYKVKGDRGNYAWDFEKHEIVETMNAYERPQCSACFIQSVDDSLMGIFELAKNEAKLFKYGSGTGSNFSNIRSNREKLSGGGTSSGLMSFLEVLDRGAGAIKSGGTTRRAAKMVVVDVDHPEIMDFVNWKVESEKKAKALIDAGYGSDWRGEAYKTVSGQNSNNSVRVTDEFMEAVKKNEKFYTKFRNTNENCEEFEAQKMFDQICEAAWSCADPGLQFDTTINTWHTSPNSGRIKGSNPCSEYMFLDDTACNLASLNLVKFLNEDGSFDIASYRHAARIFFIAQDILVDLSSYPTETIAKNSHDYRPLGLGYANLGTLLMLMGKAYDSEEGRAIASALTAILHCHAYKASAEMAEALEPFAAYKENSKGMLNVMKMHRDAAHGIAKELCPQALYEAACQDADDMLAKGQVHGYRNAQATVLAPTGTIGLLMDCDTTGVEPEFSLVKWKKLAGGGYFKIINKSIPEVLGKLGYTQQEVDEIILYVLGAGKIDKAPYLNPKDLEKMGLNEDQILEASNHVADNHTLDEWTPHIGTKLLIEKGFSKEQIQDIKLYIDGAQTLEGAPHIKEEHLAIFDCANKCGNGERYIAPLGHVRMMSAVQPFLSGAISKTVNIPHESTVEDIKKIYFQSWELGVKAIALYRDGSKHSQALSTKNSEDEESATLLKDKIKNDGETGVKRGIKHDLPAKRAGITIEASIAGQKLHLRTGEYADGQLGEIFIDSFKEGASYRSLLNCFAIAISIGLQYGVPLEKFVNAYTFTRFDPSGITSHPNIRTCTSIVDFIFRVLGMEYMGRMDFVHMKPESTQFSLRDAEGKIKAAILNEATVTVTTETHQAQEGNAHLAQLAAMMGDAPSCTECGHITLRNASCYKCLNCGASMGCS